MYEFAHKTPDSRFFKKVDFMLQRQSNNYFTASTDNRSSPTKIGACLLYILICMHRPES